MFHKSKLMFWTSEVLLLTMIFFYPRIVGGVMKVDHITIMVLLFLSSNIHGVLGMIVEIPTYSILKESLSSCPIAMTITRKPSSRRRKSLGID